MLFQFPNASTKTHLRYYINLEIPNKNTKLYSCRVLFFLKKTIPNVSSMVQAIHETLMAGAAVTIQDAPPHRRVDAAGAVALPASKARRRQLRGVRPLHGEAGGHASEAPAQDGSGPGRSIG